MSDHAFCPVYGAIDLLQEKWVLHIIRVLLDGPSGFNELGRAVGGVNTTTLSQRLERLEKAGVISRTVESVMPPRTRYELTEAGHELQDVVNAINIWGLRHMHDPAADAETAGTDAAGAEATDRLAAA